MTNFWDNKKVLVTGGAGFVGSHLVEELLRRGKKVHVTVADNLHSGKRKNLAGLKGIRLEPVDLQDFKACRKVCRGQDVVLNLAARVGGIGYNAEHHGTMFHDNMLISSNMLEAARLAEVERFLVVSSACVYPHSCAIPTPESEGFKDWPEETNEGYGWAKRMAEFQAMAYQKEFGMKIAIARPYNCYGPRDHFESDEKASHVIPALIRRVLDGKDPLRVWGDGKQTRAFLYVEDFARGLLDVTERYAVCDPVNLGTTEEVTIARLVELILKVTGSKVSVEYDVSRPSGQPRRNCDNTKAKTLVGFEAQIPLEEGLRRTVEWYRRSRQKR